MASRRRRRRPVDPRQTAVGMHHLWVLSLVRAFVARHGWKRLATKRLVVPPGVDLTGWVAKRRTAYRQDRIPGWLASECERVEGWTWDPRRDAMRRTIDRIRKLVREHGWERFPAKAGFLLNRWLVRRRDEYRRRALPRWIIDALTAIPGWTWDPRAAHYARNVRALRGHVTRYGWHTIDRRTVSRGGVSIGIWVSHIRAVHRRGSVPPWLLSALESIPGWIWDPRGARQHTRVAQLARYVHAHGWAGLSNTQLVRGVPLGQWVANCRVRYRNGSLSPETRKALEAMPGWSWSGRRSWNRRRDRTGRFSPRARSR